MELVMLQFENKIANMILNKMEEANLINTVIEKERHNQGKIDKVEKREEKIKLLGEIDKVEKREREKKNFYVK